MTKADLQIQRLAAAEDAVFVEATRRLLAAKSSIPDAAAAVEARMHAPPTRSGETENQQ
jgi:hypothetical protein